MGKQDSKKIRKRYLRIRTLMLRKGITAGDIVRTQGVESTNPEAARRMVNTVIAGVCRSSRIEIAISAALGLTPEQHEKIWPPKEEKAA